MPSKDGAVDLKSGGELMLDDDGRWVLTDPLKQPCCCAELSCSSLPMLPCRTFGSCTICCCDENGTLTLTFSEITPSADIAGKTYEATVLAMIEALSAQTVVLERLTSSGCFWALFGPVTQVDCCLSFTWRVLVQPAYSLDDGYMRWSMWLDVVRTNQGGRVEIGDEYPCKAITGSILELASTSATADGNCCNPTETLVADNYDDDYLAGGMDATSGVAENDCSFCTLSELPSTLTLDLLEFDSRFPAGATSVFTMTGAFGIVGISEAQQCRLYTSDLPDGETWITVGEKRYFFANWIELENNPSDGSCCWQLNVGLQLQELIEGEWVTIYSVNRWRGLLCPRDTIIGTYVKTDASDNPPTVGLT